MFEKIQRIIAATLSVSEASVLPDVDLEDDLGADSHDRVELTMALEDEFSIDIDDDTAATFRTPQDIQTYLESL